MTDRFTDINAIGGLGRNPLTNAGRVAINGFIDEEEIITRKENFKSSRKLTFYGGPVDDEIYRVFPRELCYAGKFRQTGRRNKHKASNPYVLSVVNGAFKATQTLYEIIDSIDFKGLAGGQGADADSKNPEVDFALVQGGFVTITNTGTKRIANGDWIYWTLPDKDKPYHRAIRGSNRMVLHTMPFDPALDQLTEDTIGALMMKRINRMDYEMDNEYTSPIEEGAENLLQVLMQIYLEAFHVFVSSGIIKIDEKAIDDPMLRERNARQYMQEIAYRQKVLLFIGNQLGIKNMNNNNSNGEKFTFREDVTSQRVTTLQEFVLTVFLAMKNSTLMLPLENGTKTLPTGVRGEIIKNQRSAVSDLFAGVNSSNRFVTRRIFAKAMSPADPGKDMDVNMGRYMA